MENQGKSVYEKGRKDKTKIKEVEENWKSVEMERVAEKSSYWTRAMAWLQQLAPDVTMKLLVIYQHIDKFAKAAQFGLRLSSADRRSPARRCWVRQESSR